MDSSDGSYYPDRSYINLTPSKTLIEFLGLTELKPLYITANTFRTYWNTKLSHQQKIRLLNEIYEKDQASDYEMNDMFEKLENLYKDKNSWDMAKGHTIISSTPLFNAMLVILVEIMKKRIMPLLREHSIHYTDGENMHLFNPKLSFDCPKWYVNDFSGQDARQNFTAVANIFNVYKTLGLQENAAYLLASTYYKTAKQRGGPKVTNGIFKPTGGPDTGFGNLINNLCVHAKLFKNMESLKQLFYAIILGDDMTIAKQTHFSHEQQIITQEGNQIMTMKSEFNFDHQQPEFCSRKIVMRGRYMYFVPNLEKTLNSLLGTITYQKDEKKKLSSIMSVVDLLQGISGFNDLVPAARVLFQVNASDITAEERYKKEKTSFCQTLYPPEIQLKILEQPRSQYYLSSIHKIVKEYIH